MIAIYLAPLYLLLNVYFLFRILKWLETCHVYFKKKWIKAVLAMIYVFLAFSILIAFLFPQGTIRRAMKLISNYWLGVLMYLALTILIADLIRLILIYFVKADQKKFRTPKVFRIVGSICMILILLISFYGVCNARNIRTTSYKYVFGINHPDFETLLDKNETIQLDQYLKNEQILPIKPMEEKVQTIKKQIKKFKGEIKKEEQTRYFNPNDVSALSHITVSDAKHILEGTALYDDAKAYVKAEEKYHVNAVFLMGIAAHESAWGTSRRAREDNNLTGYGVTSDHAKGINKSTKEAGLLATAETLHEKYLTSGGSYYVGTSAAAVNKHYCVGGEWAAAVVKNAYLLMNRL